MVAVFHIGRPAGFRAPPPPDDRSGGKAKAESPHTASGPKAAAARSLSWRFSYVVTQVRSDQNIQSSFVD